MSLPVVLVSKLPQAEALTAIREELAGVADVVFLPDLDPEGQSLVLREARAAMTYHPWRDLGPECLEQLVSCQLLQCMTAGIDYLPLRDLPESLPVAYNAGAFAEPMAEHVLAMALAGAKRLRGEHLAMQAGEFNQFAVTKQVRGAVCGILGFGETGRAVARLLMPLGLRIHAINRSGRTDEDVEFIGTLDDVGAVLERSDYVVITLALTTKTDGLIDAAALSRVKKDAVLINVARGEIIDQDALYAHLLANPHFIVGLESWWIEPVRHGRFETRHDFLSLPNVIGSPHNSAMIPGALIYSARQAARNVHRLLTGEGARYIAGDDVKMS